MPEFNFENLLKIALPIFIILGLTELTSYYYQFYIPILEYLDFTEILTAFLSNFYMYLYLLLPIFALLFLNENNPKASGFFGILLFITILIVDIINIKPDTPFVLSVTIEVSIIILILIGVKFLKLEETTLTLFRANKSFWSIAFLFFMIGLVIISISSSKKASDVKDSYLYYGTSISVGAITIVSDSTFFYVGKTKEYIFFYNEKDSTSSIYPISKIDKLVLKTKEPNRDGGDRPHNIPPSP